MRLFLSRTGDLGSALETEPSVIAGKFQHGRWASEKCSINLSK